MPLLAAILAISGLFSVGFSADTDSKRLAPIYPTPEAIVERMLELVKLQAGERICDLGSGDGRVVVVAATEFHAKATGIEIDDKLYRESTARIRQLHLGSQARIIHGDLRNQGYSSYDVITVYLNKEANEVIKPMLERELKKGARVISHDFEFQGWRPTKIDTIDDDGSGKSHVLYLYQR
jgi:protein-L-isoaspartate O-methyltransferase